MSQKVSVLEAVSEPEKLPVCGSFETGAKMYSSDSSSLTQELFYINREDWIDEIADNNMFWLDGDTAASDNNMFWLDGDTAASDNNMFWLDGDSAASVVTSDSDGDLQVSHARGGGSKSDDDDDEFYGFHGLEDLGEYVYRVCRPDEDISEAIVCSDPTSNRTVSQHVSSGTTIPSRFISTTVNQDVSCLWAFYNMQAATRPRRRQPLRIVRIRLQDVKAIPKLEEGCVNLNNTNVREHFILGAITRNFARSSKEVLFQYRIPSSCYNVVVDPVCPPQPPRKRKRISYAKIVKLMKKIDL